MSMNYSLKDLYPTLGHVETSTEVIPEAEDMEALAENAEEAQTAKVAYARGKNIIIAVGIVVACIFFLGGSK